MKLRFITNKIKKIVIKFFLIILILFITFYIFVQKGSEEIFFYTKKNILLIKNKKYSIVEINLYFYNEEENINSFKITSNKKIIFLDSLINFNTLITKYKNVDLEIFAKRDNDINDLNILYYTSLETDTLFITDSIIINERWDPPPGIPWFW